jgi:hypothetical protein
MNGRVFRFPEWVNLGATLHGFAWACESEVVARHLGTAKILVVAENDGRPSAMWASIVELWVQPFRGAM